MTSLLDKMNEIAKAKRGDRYRVTEVIGTLGGSSVARLPVGTIVQVDCCGGSSMVAFTDIGDRLHRIFIDAVDFPSLEKIDPESRA